MTTEEIEHEIAATMSERGIDYAEALFAVGLKYGELHGDLLFMRPLTAEQRRQLIRPLHEVMLELGEIDEETLLALRLPERNGRRDGTPS